MDHSLRSIGLREVGNCCWIDRQVGKFYVEKKRNLERTFQLNDLSNSPFHLHICGIMILSKSVINMTSYRKLSDAVYLMLIFHCRNCRRFFHMRKNN